jgi:hypothetical protein
MDKAWTRHGQGMDKACARHVQGMDKACATHAGKQESIGHIKSRRRHAIRTRIALTGHNLPDHPCLSMLLPVLH